MKRYSIIMAFILTGLISYGQYAEDALRVSQVYYQGTARSAALGGAMGALGGDFLSASTNPAGMGMYRSLDWSITPEVSTTRINSIYNNSATEDFKTVFDLSNLGYVIAKPLSANGWKYFQFGFGMNRLNNYNTAMYISGDNLQSSKLDAYADLAYGINYNSLYSYDPYELGQAWDQYLLDTIPGTVDQYYTPVPFGGVRQQLSVVSKGSTNEWLFSFSGNYDERLYIGATIGLPYTRYFRESTYSEYDIADTIPWFNNWSHTENLTTTGWGINLKLGLIYKPTEWLRLGGAFHTPTYFWSMSDTWNTYTYADLEDFESKSELATGNFDYRLSTPLRALANVGVLFGPHGFLTFDYEYADYSTSRFSARAYSFNDVNTDIRNVYQPTHNFRGGIEWRFSNLSLRGGYSLYGSPYADNLNDGKRQFFSGGIGYRNEYFTADIAYVRSVMNEDYYLYTTEYVQSNPTYNEFTGQRFMLTLRFIVD